MMKLEDQLAQLAEIGLPLNEGITVNHLLLFDSDPESIVNDLLLAGQRKDFEEKPFGLILWIMGCALQYEPWGRSICSPLWHFDCECVHRPDIYTNLVTRLCEAAGFPEHIKDIDSFVDLEKEEAWLKYTVNGVERYHYLDVNYDWVDCLTLAYVMNDIEHDGCLFYDLDTQGQTKFLLYLSPEAAETLSKLANITLEPASM